MGSTTSPFGPSLEFFINRTDKNAIKSLNNLFTNRSNSFLSALPGTISDMSGNTLVTILPFNALQASSYSPDTIAPFLVGFDLDLNTGKLITEFDESVLVSSLATTELTLQQSRSASNVSYSLRSSTSSDSDRALLTIDLQPEDLNEIKRIALCTSVSDCFLSFSNATVTDMAGYSVLPRHSDNAAPVRTFSADAVRPRLIEFNEFNLALNTLTLSFDETVDASSLQPTQLTLQSLFEPPFVGQHTLVGGTVLTSDNTSLTFAVDARDQVAIKSSSHLCTRRFNCYLTATASLVNDMAGNDVVPVTNGAPGRIVTRFIPDTQSPRLLTYYLDFNSGRLTVRFDEAVKASSLQTSAITFQAGANDTTAMHTLTGGSSSSSDGIEVEIDLSDADISSLKSLDLGTSSDRTFLSATSNLITDMAFAANTFQPILSDSARGVTTYTADTTLPTLDSFTLDKDSDLLVLTFSEPVNVTSVEPTSFTLQSLAASASLALSGARVTTPDSRPGSAIVTLHLQPSDIITIKLNSTFGTTRNNTDLVVSAQAAIDMSNNAIASTSSSPLAATSVVPDTTVPRSSASRSTRTTVE